MFLFIHVFMYSSSQHFSVIETILEIHLFKMHCFTWILKKTGAVSPVDPYIYIILYPVAVASCNKKYDYLDINYKIDYMIRILIHVMISCLNVIIEF